MTTDDTAAFYYSGKTEVKGRVPEALKKDLRLTATHARNTYYGELVRALVEPANAHGWKFVVYRPIERGDEYDWTLGLVAMNGADTVELFFWLGTFVEEFSLDWERLKKEEHSYLVDLAKKYHLPLASEAEEPVIREQIRQIYYGQELRKYVDRIQPGDSKVVIKADPERPEVVLVAVSGSSHFLERKFSIDHLDNPADRRSYLVSLAEKHGVPLASEAEEEVIRERINKIRTQPHPRFKARK
jgi:hypothetical protein